MHGVSSGVVGSVIDVGLWRFLILEQYIGLDYVHV